MAPGECLVDDAHFVAGGGAGCRELAARHQRRAHRLEKARADGVKQRFPGGPNSVDEDDERGFSWGKGRPAGIGGRPHARKLFRCGVHFRVQRRKRRAPEARAASVDIDQHDPIGAESAIQAAEILQGLDEESGRDEQKHRQRELRGHENGPGTSAPDGTRAGITADARRAFRGADSGRRAE
jgi:hypothetical protein